MRQSIHQRRYQSQSKQRGLTLTDTLLTLAIAGVVISGVGILFLRGLTDSKTNVGYQQYIVMQKSVRELYSGQPNFVGLDNDLMYNSGFVPSDIKGINLGEMRNTWGGAVNVTVNAGTNDFFDVSFENVPNESCTRIVSYSGNQRGSTDGLDSITVTANGSDVVFNSFPAAVADIVAACVDANDENILTWTAF
jgi:type II secretory pathway pseudopilin PulG